MFKAPGSDAQLVRQ